MEENAIIDLNTTTNVYSPWNYLKDSMDFLKKNFLALILFTIISAWITWLIYNSLANLNTTFFDWTWLLLLVYFTIFSAVIINFIHKKTINKNISFIQSIKQIHKKILWSFIINLITSLMMMIFIIPMFIWFLYIIAAAYLFSGSPTSELIWTYALVWFIAIFIWLILFIITSIFLSKYSFSIQNKLINWHKIIQSLKESNKQVFWIKWKIVWIEISAVLLFIIFTLTILYMFDSFIKTNYTWHLTVRLVVIEFWSVTNLFLYIIYTKLFLNVTWINK